MALEILSPSTQVASYLRKELLKGTWRKQFPGTPALAAELEVDRKTIIAAILQLEEEGILTPQGHGRPRMVTLPKTLPTNILNISVLPYEDSDRQLPYLLELVNKVEHQGHNIRITNRTLTGLGMDARRTEKYVEQNPAGAWIVVGASYEILEWFSSNEPPVLAIFGRRRRLPIASVGPNKVQALRSAVDKLVELGHRRIVMFAREERRKPVPGYIEKAFLNMLESYGIPPGPYHLPDWDDHPDSFHACLENLFRHTPPTALIFDEPKFLFAAQQHLAAKGIVAPRDISFISSDSDSTFPWCQPTTSHIQWESRPIVQHAFRWIQQLSEGKNLRKVIDTPATFIEGGTIGPPP